MTALSAGILFFLVFMLSIAASINYLRDRRDRRATRSSNYKNDSTGADRLDEMSTNNLLGRSSKGSAADGGRALSAADARVYAKPTMVKAQAAKPATNKPAYARKYRAVSVRPQLNCCRAVLVFEHIRFLAEEAPHFPVPGCSAENCRCQYIYHADRREEDRRSSFGIARGWTPAIGGERRGSDRRRAQI